MCRLFGFRSNTAAWVHRSLLTEKNSLRTQSIEHPDGWGIAYYLDGKFPEVAHGVGPAHSDPEFERVSNLLSSHAVVAHVRSASVGRVHLSNAHPFTYQNWSFAHNGTLTNFSSHQQRLESAIDSEFLPLLRSETDSERCFLLFLTELKQRSRLRAPPVADVARALARITELVARITDEPGGKPSSMNFLVTDGTLMAATRRRKTLFCSARAVEGSPAPSDSIETRLEQVVIASEELQCRRNWYCDHRSAKAREVHEKQGRKQRHQRVDVDRSAVDHRRQNLSFELAGEDVVQRGADPVPKAASHPVQDGDHDRRACRPDVRNQARQSAHDAERQKERDLGNRKKRSRDAPVHYADQQQSAQVTTHRSIQLLQDTLVASAGNWRHLFEYPCDKTAAENEHENDQEENGDRCRDHRHHSTDCLQGGLGRALEASQFGLRQAQELLVQLKT